MPQKTASHLNTLHKKNTNQKRILTELYYFTSKQLTLAIGHHLNYVHKNIISVYAPWPKPGTFRDINNEKACTGFGIIIHRLTTHSIIDIQPSYPLDIQAFAIHFK